MATTRSFSNMLNEYLTNRMLMEELLNRSYFFDKIEKEQGWKGGNLPVPFLGQFASSMAFGQLTASNDISEYAYVRGSIPTYKELWGTLVFNHADLQESNGSKIPEDTFLKMLPEQVDAFMDYTKMVSSQNLLSGPQFATVTDDTNAATGVMVVDFIDRFTLSQGCFIDDNNSAPLAVYVIAIDINTKSVTFSATRGGAFVNLAAYTVAQAAVFYHPGAQASSFTSLSSALLSLANGGSATIHGVTKTAYPHTQCINISGAAITASNILDQIFDAYTTIRSRARGNANTILLSFKHLGSIMKLIEIEKGPFSVVKQPTASQYGWTEIQVTSVKGNLTIVGIQEMSDTLIYFIDWSSMKFVSNGMFKKRSSPDGIEYFEVRNTTGFQYIVDISLWGELMVMKPSSNGVIYAVANY